jgi:hypothetical protein
LSEKDTRILRQVMGIDGRVTFGVQIYAPSGVVDQLLQHV